MLREQLAVGQRLVGIVGIWPVKQAVIQLAQVMAATTRQPEPSRALMAPIKIVLMSLTPSV